jgi:hypothetical protein
MVGVNAMTLSRRRFSYFVRIILTDNCTVSTTWPCDTSADGLNVETAIHAAGIKDDNWIQKLLKKSTTHPDRKPYHQQKQYRQQKYSITKA